MISTSTKFLHAIREFFAACNHPNEYITERLLWDREIGADMQRWRWLRQKRCQQCGTVLDSVPGAWGDWRTIDTKGPS